MRKLQTQGVHHITLVGADRATSIDFWEGVLGMPFVFEQPNLDVPAESHLYFDPMPSPPLQHQEMIPDNEPYMIPFSHCGSSHAQPQGSQSVSAVFSPYYQAEYFRTP